ncbi:hypothetical protein ACIPZ5_04875 [Pseudomonas sp. NPDC089428]|uniref:hypothetical protein n=1 Tax=Pseudomonas sp. NPDC089428 TaxID=3364467 RepID=UPI00382F1BB5
MSEFPSRAYEVSVATYHATPVKDPKHLFEKYKEGDLIPTSESGSNVPLKVLRKTLLHTPPNGLDYLTFRLEVEEDEAAPPAGLYRTLIYKYKIVDSAGNSLPHEGIPEIDYVYDTYNVGDSIAVDSSGPYKLNAKVLKKEESAPQGNIVMRTLTVEPY